MIDGFVRTDKNGRITEFTEAYRAMLGYTSGKKRHSAIFDIPPPVGTSLDATVLPVEMKTYLNRNDTGIIEGLWSITRDITGRRKADD